MLGNIGFIGFMVILFTILLLWGPTKLPELGKSIGETIRAFRQSVNDQPDEKSKKE